MTIKTLLMMVLLCQVFSVLAGQPVPDIRVAIDVSGSMKKNDPHHLRTPALKLLVGLMPDGMYSGVWTFGQYVNMQVKYGKVDDAWKRRARKEAGKIHSLGRYTNIEEAIQRASFNWKKADPRFNRNLILLTDGMVDISRDADVNQASRRRILEYWLPRLKKAKVRVHTVALSDGVDRALLNRISSYTGGWYEQVDNAEQLQRVFLRLFEKSAPQDTLPIKGNRFRVDKNVQDMTLLVFHKPGAAAVKIRTPSGKQWSAQQAPGKVSWFEEDSYDLITVKRPEAGEWVLESKSDPDNRVMVVTNLSLKVDPLADQILADEKLDVTARLMEKGRILHKPDFLKLVQFTLLDQPQGAPDAESFTLHDDGQIPDKKAADGIYGKRLNGGLAEGMHTLVVRADGATFQREFRHSYRVLKGAAGIKLKRQAEDFLLEVIPNEKVIGLETLQLELQRPDGVATELVRHDKSWQALLPATLKGKTVKIKLSAKRSSGGKSITREYTQKLITAEEKKEHTPKATAGEELKTRAETDKKDEAGEEHKGLDWTMVIWLAILINLMLIIFGILFWLYYKKRKQKIDAEEEAEMKI